MPVEPPTPNKGPMKPQEVEVAREALLDFLRHWPQP